MSDAIRLAILGCPANERCLAFDNSNRDFSFTKSATAAAAPAADQKKKACSVTISTGLIQIRLKYHDNSFPHRESHATRGPQFRAHQPDSPALGDTIYGLV